MLTGGVSVFNGTVVGFNEAAGDRIHLTGNTASNALALSNGSTIHPKRTSCVDADFFS